MIVEPFFRTRPVFLREEFVEYLDDHGGSSNPSSVNSLLRHHRGAGHLVKIRRGLYATVPPGRDTGQFRVDPYLVGALAWPEGVLAYHTALEIHGYSHSAFERIYVLCEEPRRGFEFQGIDYVPTIQPKAVLAHGVESSEVESRDRLGMNIRVTTLERTVVDCLSTPAYGGGWDEIFRSLEGIPYLDLDAVLSYVDLLDNATTAAKVGFVLEERSEDWFVEPRHLNQLEQLAPASPRYMDKDRDSSFVRRWNLMVPNELLRRGTHE